MDVYKRLFVKEILTDESARLKKNQALAMRKVLQFHSRKIINDREFQVSAASNAAGKLRMRFPAYTRFLDIGPKRNTKTGKVVRRKVFKIYNRFIFGHYYSIASRLATEYTEDTYQRIKQQLTRNSNG